MEILCLAALRQLQKSGTCSPRHLFSRLNLFANRFSTSSECYSPPDPSRGSVDPEEVNKFSRLAKHWWTEGGEFGALHRLNELRVPLIRDGLLGVDGAQSVRRRGKPLDSYTILDVGCGGGILSEPLARLGANVTGLDASDDNICTANQHADIDPSLSGCLQYSCSTVEEHSSRHGALYDGVVASEILEHVSNPKDFVTSCCSLIKPGGSLFVTTLNKTLMSYALAVIAAERILNLVPAGAHDWDKFISPQTVTEWLEAEGFRVVLIHGMLLNPLTLRWRWVSDTSMNYALHAVRTT